MRPTRNVHGGAHDGAIADATDHRVGYIDALGHVHDEAGEGRWPYEYTFGAWVAVARCPCGGCLLHADVDAGPRERCELCGAAT